MAQYLNGLLATDRTATESLLLHSYVPVGAAMEAHPHARTRCFSGTPMLGHLGLLNGALAACGEQEVAATIDDDGHITAFGLKDE